MESRLLIPPLFTILGERCAFLLVDVNEVQAPFELLWTSVWEEEGHFVIPPHVASIGREVRRHSLPLGYNESPHCP